MIERVDRLVARFNATTIGQFTLKWGEDNAGSLAVVIAYYAMVSMFPLLLALTALLGYIVQDPDTLLTFERAITMTFPSDLAGQVESALDHARDNVSGYGLVSLAGFVIFGSGLFGGIEQALNVVYRAPWRHFVLQRVLWILMMLVFFVLLSFAVVASSVSTLVLARTEQALQLDLSGWDYLQSAVGWVLSFGSLFIMFLVIYLFIPNTSLHIRQVYPGAVLSTLLFGLATQAVPIYLQWFGGSYEAYATFGLLLLMLFWFYVLGNILVLGAEVNAFLSHPHLRPGTRSAEVRTLAESPRIEDRSGMN